MGDNQIVELFFARSEQAIAELSVKYGAICYRIASNILHESADAEEVVNDTYLGVWNSVPPTRPNPLKSYVCKIARNLSLKRYRFNSAKKRNGARNLPLEELENSLSSKFTVEGQLEVDVLTKLLNDFLRGLDGESRVMFVRRYWYCDSVQDVAEFFHVSPHTMTVRLARLRKRLKKFLKEEGVLI